MFSTAKAFYNNLSVVNGYPIGGYIYRYSENLLINMETFAYISVDSIFDIIFNKLVLNSLSESYECPSRGVRATCVQSTLKWIHNESLIDIWIVGRFFHNKYFTLMTDNSTFNSINYLNSEFGCWCIHYSEFDNNRLNQNLNPEIKFNAIDLNTIKMRFWFCPFLWRSNSKCVWNMSCRLLWLWTFNYVYAIEQS